MKRTIMVIGLLCLSMGLLIIGTGMAFAGDVDAWIEFNIYKGQGFNAPLGTKATGAVFIDIYIKNSGDTDVQVENVTVKCFMGNELRFTKKLRIAEVVPAHTRLHIGGWSTTMYVHSDHFFLIIPWTLEKQTLEKYGKDSKEYMDLLNKTVTNAGDYTLEATVTVDKTEIKTIEQLSLDGYYYPRGENDTCIVANIQRLANRLYDIETQLEKMDKAIQNLK